MNSAHEQCPNSDCKQCIESKLRCARAVPRSWALLRAQPTGHALVARTASAGRTHRAQVVGISRDLPSVQSKPPRSQPQKLRSHTNFHRPARTISRHQIGVAHHSGQSRSRPQNGVATSFPLPSPRPGRDFLFQVATS